MSSFLPVRRPLLLLLSLLSYVLLAYATPRPYFWQLLALMAVAFGCYLLLMRGQLSLKAGLLAALLFRLLWLPALPALSDDYHRFQWDGLLVANGHSPYRYRPDELVPPPAGKQLLLPPLADFAATHPQLSDLYSKLNSPHYYSVYPPLSQAVFGAAAWLFPHQPLGQVVFLRLVILAAEAATAAVLLVLLATWGLDARQALWYLLNPLVVVELAGNLHLEALAGCLLLAAIWLLWQKRLAWSAGALGLAAATKLLPLLALPLLIRRLGWRATLVYATGVAAVLGFAFAPFVSPELLHNVSRSLDLYFHHFEFNGSVYYLMRTWGYRLRGYNRIAQVGTTLALWMVSGIGLFAALERRATVRTLPRALLICLTLYYLLANVVHPWYLTTLVLLSVFTPFRFAFVWSGLAVLSYAAYQTSTYQENLWLVALEYTGVGAAMLYDWQRLRRGEVVRW